MTFPQVILPTLYRVIRSEPIRVPFPVSGRGQTLALPTNTTVVSVGISVNVESMIADAMCSSRVCCREPFAPKDILPLGNGLKVRRVNASTVSTQVIYNRPRGYGAAKKLVSDPMRQTGFLFYRKAAVTGSREYRAYPKPASFSLGDLFHKSSFHAGVCTLLRIYCQGSAV